jgi:activating signal cointegrator complex subunit 1
MEDILRPQIVVIGQRRYRKNIVTDSFPNSNQNYAPYEEETEDMYTENCYNNNRSNKKMEIQIADEYNDEISCKLEFIPSKTRPNREEENLNENTDEFKDIVFDKGNFKLEMQVSESYFGFIIGRNGEKKSKLEQETQCKVFIPRKQGIDSITIEGKSHQSVASCRNRLIIMLSSLRLTKPPTHFVCFPLNFDGLVTKFNQFKQQVLENCAKSAGIDENIFTSPNKMHLTVCVMPLFNKTEIDQAINLLDECHTEFIQNLISQRELRVKLKGLESMNDDPSDVHVLYAKVDLVNQNFMQELSDRLMKKFVDAGLSKKKYDRVKLHATVMNTRRQLKQQESNDKRTRRVSFDAREIFKLYGDYDFGEYLVKEINLSIMGKNGSDGFHERVSRIKI